ncbi:MAG: hypothetical protein QOE75_113 [Solirubrobacterales bacterium]|jgi:hypothetical protein|nr:hypothetical protein [Solirubrobacterales bacterium]
MKIHRTKLITISIGLSAIVVLLVGCGGDGGGDPTADSSLSDTEAPALSKAEFIERGDEICKRTDRRQAARYKVYRAENGEDTSKQGQEALVTEIGLPTIREEIEELRALGAPAGDEQAVEAILDAAEAAADEAEADPGSVLETSASPFDEVDAMAEAYGFKACGIV